MVPNHDEAEESVLSSAGPALGKQALQGASVTTRRGGATESSGQLLHSVGQARQDDRVVPDMMDDELASLVITR